MGCFWFQISNPASDHDQEEVSLFGLYGFQNHVQKIEVVFAVDTARRSTG